MDSRQSSLRRAVLRECRRLGHGWSPSPPASDLLWGRGFQTDPAAPHPLLMHLVPGCLRGAVANGRRPLAPWLRDSFRAGGDCWTSAQSSSEDDAFVEQEALAFLEKQTHLSTCMTYSESAGFRLDAVSGFLRSDAATGQNVFAYNMRFSNQSQRRLRVLSRQYDFRESSGDLKTAVKEDQPEAAGVVGFTPVLEPGTAFEFGSGVALSSPRGSLTGRFLVMEEPELSGEELEMHKHMEKAELMLRLVYFKGLETPQFYLPLNQLHFDTDVKCVSLAKAREGS